jgi:glucose-6-phosphate isomerase
MPQISSLDSFELEYYPRISEKTLSESLAIINENKEKWESPFFTDTDSYVDLEEIKIISKPFLDDEIENIIVLGTGGSIQTLLALKHLSKKTIFPITSSRSVELYNCLNNTRSQNSVVIPISRSGKTLDVNSTIGTFVKRNYPFLGLSSRGTMKEILEGIKAPTLEVPDLSGRFAASVTNVALVPAYISGINIDEFLKGLKVGYEEFMNFKKNRCIEFASYLFNLYKKGYKIIFSMPYSKNLEGSVGLFVQEVSESTGKKGKGLMGAFQKAPLCQHSVLEYLLGGTKGAVIPLLFTVNKEMPALSLNSSIGYLNGKDANTVINYQADATLEALIKQEVPSMKIDIPTPKEQNIGILVAFIQSCVYYLCLLLDVNWANNPMVNIGKEICNKALRNELNSSERKNSRIKLAKEKFKGFF